VLLRATGQAAAAEASYREALRLNPTHLDAYHNLGILLNGLGRTEEAAACFSRLITLRPQDRDARRLLALAHCTLGEFDAARRIYAEWLADAPADPIAQHMYAACCGADAPARASDAFVAQTFDGFAASFESKLAQLAYRAPALVALMLEHVGVEPAGTFDVLDAGCGTGLCGRLVAPHARRLVGVDLSEGMLAQARQKQIYDELVHGELTAYLQAASHRFDLIVSADTLVYFGDLTAVAAAAAAALAPGGWFVFTLEQARHDARDGFRLEMHGRYTHTMAYVEQVLADAAFTTEIAQAELRMEAGAPVAGLVVAARRA
jgi:predicted TPR repeat methyltransferase